MTVNTYLHPLLTLEHSCFYFHSLKNYFVTSEKMLLLIKIIYFMKQVSFIQTLITYYV